MGVPIEPPEDPYGCCEPTRRLHCWTTNYYGWPQWECGPETWELWFKDCHRIHYCDVYAYPGCSGYCAYELVDVDECYNDGFTVHLYGPGMFLGISDNTDYTFTGYHIMYLQSFFPSAGLYCEEVLLPDNKVWVGVRDGTRNVRILFKRDLTIK